MSFNLLRPAFIPDRTDSAGVRAITARFRAKAAEERVLAEFMVFEGSAPEALVAQQISVRRALAYTNMADAAARFFLIQRREEEAAYAARLGDAR